MSDVKTTWRAILLGVWHVVDDNEPDLSICEGVTKDQAHLIAAAPQLLAALKSLCDPDASYYDNEIRVACANHGDALARMRVAREIIAKAEVGTP